MTTLKALINTAMRKAKIIGAGEEAAPEDFQDVLADLRRMVGNWRLEPLMIYVNARKQFDLQPGAASYPIGDGAAWDTERPIRILAATILDGAGGTFPLTEITATEYSRHSHKSRVGRPRHFFYEATFPMAAVRFDCVPDDPTVELVVQESLTIPDVLTAELEFPEGYEDALIYNLAVRIAPDFGKPATPEIVGLAVSYKALVKRANTVVPTAYIESPVGANVIGTYDINAGPVS